MILYFLIRHSILIPLSQMQGLLTHCALSSYLGLSQLLQDAIFQRESITVQQEKVSPSFITQWIFSKSDIFLILHEKTTF